MGPGNTAISLTEGSIYNRVLSAGHICPVLLTRVLRHQENHTHQVPMWTADKFAGIGFSLGFNIDLRGLASELPLTNSII